MTEEKYKITKEGLKNVKKKLEKLEKEFKDLTSKRGEISGQASDTWHDNAAFEDLEREEMKLGKKIKELQDFINKVEVVETGDDSSASIGSRVLLSINGKESEFELVSSVESDPSNNKISTVSPLGSAIVGASEGEKRKFKIGGKKREVEILEIK